MNEINNRIGGVNMAVEAFLKIIQQECKLDDAKSREMLAFILLHIKS